MGQCDLWRQKDLIFLCMLITLFDNVHVNRSLLRYFQHLAERFLHNVMMLNAKYRISGNIGKQISYIYFPNKILIEKPEE